jgi:hypothetical protein
MTDIAKNEEGINDNIDDEAKAGGLAGLAGDIK